MESVLEAPSRPTRPTRTAAARSLAPREHGAYGQLAFPLAVAHLTGSPTWTGGLFTVAALAAFLGHEPCLVLLGRRGARARRELERRARELLLACVALGLGSGAAALALASPAVRLGALGPAVLAPVVALFIYRDAEHSLAGELLVGATLPALALPIAMAGGVEPTRALATWTVWTLANIAATTAVRSVISHLKEPSSLVQRAAGPFGVLLVAGLLSGLDLLDAKAIVALVPTLEVAAVAALLAPHPRHLRSVGWALVAATVITAILLCL